MIEEWLWCVNYFRGRANCQKIKKTKKMYGIEKVLTSFVAIAVPFLGGVGLTCWLACKPGFPTQKAF